MKFGRRMLEEAYEPFQDNYISYKALKKAIKLITGNDTSTCTISEVTDYFSELLTLKAFAHQPPEVQFQNLLHFEVKKINTFALKTFDSLKRQLNEMIQKYEQNIVSEETNEMDANDLALRVVKLQHYVRLNFMGFRKITKKYDKHNETAASCWYLGGILREPFMGLDFDFLVEMVAYCFKVRATYKSLKKEDNESYFCGYHDKIDILSRSFLQTMTHSTYLINEDNMMHIRIELAKNFPLISIGDSTKLPYKSSIQENTTRHNSSPCSLPNVQNPQNFLTSKSNFTHENIKTTTSFSQLPLNKNDISLQCPLLPMKSLYCFKKSGICCVYFDSPCHFKMYTKALQNPFETCPYILRFRWNTSLEKNPMKFPDGMDYSTSSTFNLKNYLPETLMIEFVTSPLIVADSCESWNSFKVMDSESQLLVTSEIAEIILKNKYLDIDATIKDLKEVDDDKARVVLKKILHTIHVDQCQPIIQHWYHRTQFRYVSKEQDKQIFITLDENIRFLPIEPFNSTKEPCSTFSFWWNSSLCSSPTALEKIGINSPFGVLSVSYIGMQRPLVVSRIVGLSSVLEIWNYSSFIHGIAACFHDQLLPSQKPEWLHLVRHSPTTLDTFTTPPRTPSVEHDTTYKGKKKKIGYKDSGIRVDIMSTKPRDRVIHEHASDLQIQSSPCLKLHEKNHQDYVLKNSLQSSNAPALKPKLYTMHHPALKTPLLSMQQDTHFYKETHTFWFQNLWNEWKRKAAFYLFLPSPCSKHLESNTIVRVEPKTFFANERTLLQWLNTAVLLSTISVTLLNFGSSASRRAGFIMAPVALFFIAYSFKIYLTRSYSLERKEAINYNDRFGPTVLVVSLIGALSSILLLNIMNPET